MTFFFILSMTTWSMVSKIRSHLVVQTYLYSPRSQYLCIWMRRHITKGTNYLYFKTFLIKLKKISRKGMISVTNTTSSSLPVHPHTLLVIIPNLEVLLELQFQKYRFFRFSNKWKFYFIATQSITTGKNHHSFSAYLQPAADFSSLQTRIFDHSMLKLKPISSYL